VKRATLLVLLGLAGCDTSPSTPTGGSLFPDALVGIIPYHTGGQFTGVVHVDADRLIGPTHALVSLDSALAPSTAMPQAITLYPGDGGLDGATVLTWPRGGDVVVHARLPA